MVGTRLCKQNHDAVQATIFCDIGDETFRFHLYIFFNSKRKVQRYIPLIN